MDKDHNHGRSETAKTEPQIENETLDETIDRCINGHMGTCDACGTATFVIRSPVKQFDFMCSGCVVATGEGRKRNIEKLTVVLG